MDESLFKYFPALPQDDRGRFLTEFASHFQPSDWWHLDKLLEQQAMYRRFDVIPALPVELAVNILQYLPLPELFENRRVSRRWHIVLSSDVICRGLALARFPMAAREFINSQQSDNYTYIKSWKCLFEDLASRSIFFSQGKFITYPQLNYPLFAYSKYYKGRICLSDKNLANWDSRIIRLHECKWVLDIVYIHDPAQTICFHAPNREPIHSYALKGELLIVVTILGKCHAYRLTTGERKTMPLESCAGQPRAIANDTVGIVFKTNIVVWDISAGVSWRIETSVVEPGGWAYELDPVSHIISRIYFDKASSVVWQEQFQYGMEVTEHTPQKRILKRLQQPYTDLSAKDNRSSNHHAFAPLDVCSQLWKFDGLGQRYQFPLPDKIKGLHFPSLAYDYSRGEWSVRDYTMPEGSWASVKSRAFVLDNCTALVNEHGNGLGNTAYEYIHIYLVDEDRWETWSGAEWHSRSWPAKGILDMSERYVLYEESTMGDTSLVELRMFMGIHELKAFEELLQENAVSAYGPLVKMRVREPGAPVAVCMRG